MRQVKSFTISSEIMAEISNTKGTASTSERVNELLRRALDLERRERLEQEAKEFFGEESEKSRRERSAFQKASRQALSRD
jgi:Arc/MetJ family transcription regulator